MSRSQFAIMTLMFAVAIFAGVVVASLVPPVPRAEAQELDLVPPPASGATVVVPSFADLAERAMPSVVQIVATRYTSQDQDPLSLPEFFRRFQREQGPEDDQRREMPERQGGSGFFITRDGYIITNKHVIQGAEEFEVTTYDGGEYRARPVGSDPYMDFAILKIDDGPDFQALPLGDSDKIRVGEWVIAIGHPLTFRNTVTAGVVSGTGRQLGFSQDDLASYIQTDAAINFGNSGGPLLNARGEVVGINTAILRGGMQRNLEGLGFALPVNEGKRVLDEIVATGTVRHGWIGVSITNVDRDELRFFGLDDMDGGAKIASVTSNSPADDAGLRADDIILEVDGYEVESSGDLVTRISRRSPGDAVRIVLLRPSRGSRELERKTVEVVLGDRTEGLRGDARSIPSPEPSVESVVRMGFEVEEMPGAMRQRLLERDIQGVLVTDVDPKSNAFRKGLRESFIISEVNRKPVTDLVEYRDAIASIESGEIVQLLLKDENGNERAIFFEAENGG